MLRVGLQSPTPGEQEENLLSHFPVKTPPCSPEDGAVPVVIRQWFICLWVILSCPRRLFFALIDNDAQWLLLRRRGGGSKETGQKWELGHKGSVGGLFWPLPCDFPLRSFGGRSLTAWQSGPGRDLIGDLRIQKIQLKYLVVNFC